MDCGAGQVGLLGAAAAQQCRAVPSCTFPLQCKKKHTLLCPDFSRRGICPRAAQCQLLHRTRKCLSRRAAPAPEPSDIPSRSR